MQSKIEQENNIQQTKEKANLKLKLTTYSCYFEVQLKHGDFGKSREKHNNICNKLLLKQIEELNKEGIQLCAEISNDALVKKICLQPNDPPHPSLTWEHCHSQTANGKEGIMRLVPKSQHKSGSEYWRVFHPDHKNRGGYHEWAKPNGAPVKKPKNYPKDFKFQDIPNLKPEELSDAFLVAVKTNRSKKFFDLIDRAKQLISEEELGTILTKFYVVGSKGKKETLLHLAAVNNNVEITSNLLTHFIQTPNFSQVVNYQGNTPAHIAAENNRPLLLKKLSLVGIDLTIKNNCQKTVFDIASERKYSSCLRYCTSSDYQSSTQTELSEQFENTKEQKQNPPKKSICDPQFTYGGNTRHQPDVNNSFCPPNSQNSVTTLTRTKNFRELMGLPAQPTKEGLAAQEARDLERLKENQAPRKTFRELMGLPAQPAKEELAAREARDLERLNASQVPRKTFRELMGLPAQPTKEELAAQEARDLERLNESQVPRKTFRELMGLPDLPTNEERVSREPRDQKIKKENTTPPNKEGFIVSLQKNKEDFKAGNSININKSLPQKALANKLSRNCETVLPAAKPLPNKNSSALATSIALQKIINDRIEKQNKQKQESLCNENKTLMQPKSHQQLPKKEERNNSITTAKDVQSQVIQPRVQQYTQPRVQQYTQPRVQQYAQPRVQQYAQPRVQQYSQPRVQQYAQPRVQQYAQPRAQQYSQPQAQQRAQQQAQQQAQQRAQQQAQQRAQQQAQQRAQQQAQQKAQQQAQQRAQQQAQQQAQQRAQQRAQQQAQQQAQRAAAVRSAHQAASVRAAQQQAQQRAQQTAAQRAYRR
ncbi:ankyrin repeat domain-containing protein [Legionella jordanis]|uniref:ankyrin repeat domain-containing protein n=1 Tax=Legionella jordanis TaxID=456 RepID=UPI0013EF6C21|nr:ankyrin repeat domain-containing protein [Legionella jordanis]